jgi:hypothetical protein
MLPTSDDKTLKAGPRTRGDAGISSQRISRLSLLATLGIGACVAASVAAGLGSPANAQPGDNPSPALLAKIQLATQATNRTTILSRAPRKPSLNRAAVRTFR